MRMALVDQQSTRLRVPNLSSKLTKGLDRQLSATRSSNAWPEGFKLAREHPMKVNDHVLYSASNQSAISLNGAANSPRHCRIARVTGLGVRVWSLPGPSRPESCPSHANCPINFRHRGACFDKVALYSTTGPER